MSSFPRTVKGFLSLGPSRFMRQLNNIGDTKIGTLVGTDKFGNQYFENLNESYAYKSYNTTRPKFQAWTPKVAKRA
ncbi:hypothetical protein CPB97_008520 [Podila verticillata]|nr:hypothetical protein CPB97_008520 [Podila verticillata]